MPRRSAANERRQNVKKGVRETRVSKTDSVFEAPRKTHHYEKVAKTTVLRPGDMVDTKKVMAEQRAEEAKRTPEQIEAQKRGEEAPKPRVKRKRTLVIYSRGLSTRDKGLANDLKKLLPHHKEDSPVDAKGTGAGEMIQELCDLKHCDSVIYFENRKRQDLYLWLSTKDGISAKFQVQSIALLNQLRMPGNCIKYSRPLLHFDASFRTEDDLGIFQTMLTELFGVPNKHPESRPFVDHILAFYWLDGKIWFRNYQIVESRLSKTEVRRELLEIGPRFMLTPIQAFTKLMVGKTLYKNPTWQSPNQIRSQAREEGKMKEQREQAEKEMAKLTAAGGRERLQAPAVPGFFDREEEEEEEDSEDMELGGEESEGMDSDEEEEGEATSE